MVTYKEEHMLGIKDITDGDIVKLVTGQSVVVHGLWTSYSDRQGEHPGPGITTAGTYEHILLTDVVEVVRKNDRLCVYCGGGVTSTNPEVDFCRSCHYTGTAKEHDIAPLIDALQSHDNVATAEVWHTGGGCFLLAVKLTDGRIATCTAGEASLPDEHEPLWQCIGVWPSESAYDDSDYDSVDYLGDDLALDDEAFVARIAAL
jgi:hypothetical protein